MLDTNNDGNADTNVDTDDMADSAGSAFQVACGSNSNSTGSNSTAMGYSAQATGSESTALGSLTKATMQSSTALGFSASVTGTNAIALGANAFANGNRSIAIGSSANANGLRSLAVGENSDATEGAATALGSFAQARSGGATSLGFAAGSNLGVAVTDSPESIAIGHRSSIAANSPGAIAIGGDLDGDGFGAQATAYEAIAIGADVIANKARTMTVGVPIEVKASSGKTQILINEKSAGNAVKTLFNLVCDSCTPGFRFNQTFPANSTWNFRMLQSGAFSVDDPATIAKEAEFRSGGDLKIGGTIIQSSSRENKKHIIDVNSEEIMSNIEALPIYRWTYKHDTNRIRHIGPMSEDFYRAFGLGDSDKEIAGVDTAGVAFAAIKSIHQANKRLKEEQVRLIAELKNQNSQLNARILTLESKLIEVENLKQQLAVLLLNTDNSRLPKVVLTDSNRQFGYTD